MNMIRMYDGLMEEYMANLMIGLEMVRCNSTDSLKME